MPASPFDHPHLSALIGDPLVEDLFSATNELTAMLAFEAALASAHADASLIPKPAAARIIQVCEAFEPDHDDLRAGAARDGLIVPALIKQLRAAVGDAHSACLHLGSTSQDVIDTALTFRLASVFDIFLERQKTLIDQLVDLEHRYGAQPMSARTRMQVALPITVADRLRLWRRPLNELADRTLALKSDVCKVQLGGPVGTNGDLAEVADRVTERVAELLGLSSSHPWHTDRRSLMDYASWLVQLSAACGKIGQDIALMAQNEMGEISLKGSGGSSAMPHKQNPIIAEILVSLHRANAAHLSALAQSLVHENERSGTAWSLEWLLLPQLTIGTGASLLLTARLLDSVSRMGSAH